MRPLVLANARNGLAYPHDMVAYFHSTHGHHAADGYFRIDAMPYSAAIHLMRGGVIQIVDGTQHAKPLSDALRYGVPTWCLVYNRAMRRRDVRVCDWQTPDMVRAANSAIHRPLVGTLRKLMELYPPVRPLTIGDAVWLICHPQIAHDDKPDVLRAAIGSRCQA